MGSTEKEKKKMPETKKGWRGVYKKQKYQLGQRKINIR